jgi:hypothetical protein
MPRSGGRGVGLLAQSRYRPHQTCEQSTHLVLATISSTGCQRCELKLVTSSTYTHNFVRNVNK